MSNKELLYDHFTKDEIKKIKRKTGLKKGGIANYLELDFIDCDEPIPCAKELIDHINYQQELCSMFQRMDDPSETDFSIAWSARFA